VSENFLQKKKMKRPMGKLRLEDNFKIDLNRVEGCGFD
jgi:hypothetical protein